MAACPGGARPKAGLTAGTALLTLGLLGTDVIEHIAHVWPGLTAQTIWGRVDIATLCAQNPSDPGPPSTEDLAYTAILAAQAAGGSLGGAYGSWAMAQANYQVFVNSCECIQPGETIPPRASVPPPTGEPPYPTGHGDQDPLTRIEQNQSTASDALTVLYNGLQRVATDLTDLRGRQVPSNLERQFTQSWTMSGEGVLDLVAATPSSGTELNETPGILVDVQTLPDKYKVHGTLTPRYYGIGNIMFDSTYNSSIGYIISKRHSLHYLTEFVEAPRQAIAYRLRWQLQPGASATAYQMLRRPDMAAYQDWGRFDGAYTPMHNAPMPPTWSDPPFYPIASASSSRVYALGGVP